MITNTTAKSTYVVAEGVIEYAVGFTFGYNPDLTPQIKVYVNKLSNTPLVYGVDYTISQNQLNIVLLTQFNAGDRLDIIRDIPFVQISDYVIGRIDPEQIEADLDLAVMRDQQIAADIDLAIEIPEDHEERIQVLESDVDTIENKIPNQATDENQLADKNFVNSSIATSTATFRGTYNSLAELEAVTADDNDYGFVVSTDQASNTIYSRYKYADGSWVFEYNLNNSSFTSDQWTAINSGATPEIINSIASLPAAIAHMVVEFQAPTADNNYTWYRKYADGWVEQGGITTPGNIVQSIVLPITMADTNYTISLVATSNNASGLNNVGIVGYENVSTTGFDTRGNTVNGNSQSSAAYGTRRWEVKGMMVVGANGGADAGDEGTDD